MIPALWISKTGLDAQQMQVGVISNNLANASTTGYKRSRGVFEDLMYQGLQQAGASSSQDTKAPTGMMLGTGVKIVATQKNFKQGNTQQTDNPLDISISGRGFFEIDRNGSKAYTRDGSFQLDADRNIVTAEGYKLGSLQIPEHASSITIGLDGTVTANVAGETGIRTVGQIQLADFTNPAGLMPIGQNQYIPTVSSGEPKLASAGTNGYGLLYQNTLESSNVNVVEELVGLIETQRAYEMNSKAIQTVDGMLSFASQNL